jgi:hypothetical protein
MVRVTEMKQPSWRSVLPVHPAAELFPLLSPAELRELGEDIRKHGLQEPITVVRQYRRRADGTLHVGEYDLVLLDGRNRLEAMERAGFALIRDGKLDKTLGHRALGLEPLTGGGYAELDSDVDPYAFVISRNIHRRHLTAEQKREIIAKLLQADPSKSDRQIAETVKASPTTVGTVRSKMESHGDVSKLDTRRDSKGRNQPAKKKRGKTPSETAARPIHTEIYAPEKRDDIGPNSSSEAERQRARNEELERENRRLARENAALKREIEELRARLPASTDHGDGLDIPEFLRRSAQRKHHAEATS